MKVKRHKKFQRNMSFFEKNFKFRTPYQILIDGTFAQAALYNKVNMKDQLPKYLDGQVKLLTTTCTQVETETLGPELYGALQILKQTPIHKCPHMEKPVCAATCLKSMVKDSGGGYVVATQDSQLRYELRNIPGIPIVYLNGTAPTMEKPSDLSVRYAEAAELKRMEVLGYQKEILNHYKGEFGSTTVPVRKGTKKRKRAGPNPLSCKKSKKIQPLPLIKPEPKKRKRVRVRYAKHLKDSINESI